ncbi:MAG: DUF2877 domain-containing protein [Caldisericia bacterium]|nr:DUF2877 domain-containing protein [Caldisericia bacterium]
MKNSINLLRKLNVLSFGDFIENGEYILHSKFTNSINFYKGERILTIGNKLIGGGPSNIIIDEISSIFDKNYLLISDNFLDFGFEKVYIDKESFYDSKLKIDSIDKRKFYENLGIFEKFVKIFSKEKGLSKLLNKNFNISKENLFDKFVIKIYEGSEILFNGNLEDGVNKIKGIGVGLTPSGDDFLYGFLVGLNILEILNNLNLKEIKRKVYLYSKGENLISNNFLYFASEGTFFEKTKNLIFSLFYGDEREILENTLRILQIGETSGVDFSTGLIFTLKKGGEDVCKRFN